MYQWEFDGPARLRAESFPLHVQRRLVEFMEAVVIVDPPEYQRNLGQPDNMMRTLPFGQHDEGLITFLNYPPGELVLVAQVQWLDD